MHEEDVAEEEHERPVDERLELAHGVRETERLPLVDILDAHAELPAVAEGADDLEPEMPDHDDHAAHPEIPQAFDLVLEERLPEDREDGLRIALAEGQEARALAGGKDDAEQRGSGLAHGATIIPAR